MNAIVDHDAAWRAAKARYETDPAYRAAVREHFKIGAPPGQEDVYTEPFRPRLIGLWAPAPQSGKSTAAEALLDTCRCGGEFYGAKVSMADPLRRLIAAFLRELGVSPDDIDAHMHDGALKEVPIPGVGKSFAELAVMFGTTVGRDWISPTIWVDRFVAITSKMLENPATRLVVCDDVRFPNEAAVIRDLGGVLIGVNRPGAAVSAARAAAEGRLSFDDMDGIVVNNEGVDMLRRRAVGVARKLGVWL